MVLWHFTLGFLLDAGICSLGFWILAELVNVIDDPNELPFWCILVGIFFLIALVPNIWESIKGYRNNKFFSSMASEAVTLFLSENSCK
jgi:hypothetical protein